ncbi:MAG: SpoIIE family protein phosphatase [Deltaproteobacteria bacterium]|nr:SpoIIE family protein phosphatase [Deltaproteobacteria bacterium]
MKNSVKFRVVSNDDIVPVFEQSLKSLVQKFSSLHLSRQLHADLKLAFVEAVANATRHAKELDNTGAVCGRFVLTDRLIGFDVEDHGLGFDIAKIEAPSFDNWKDCGRGVFLLKQLGEKVEYKIQKTKNVLKFRRVLFGRAHSQEIDLIYELSQIIISEASLEEVYQTILERALSVFKVERASILIFDEKINRLKLVASRGISQDVKDSVQVRSGDGVSGFVFKHARPLLIEDIDKDDHAIEKKEHYKTRSFISAPMILQPLRLDERPIGVINLTDRKDGKRFSKKDLKILSTIANQAMACLHIRHLVEEVREAESLKIEMEQIRQIQESYLPSESPQVPGYDMAGLCDMAQSVGGDYFDYIFVNDRLYLVVADVCGHNMSSAVTMVNFRAQLRAVLSFGYDPAEVLRRLNVSLFEDLGKLGQFVSCVLMELDPSTGQIIWSNAGHYLPEFLSGQVVVSDSGLVLGVDADERYENYVGQIDPGQGLVLYTDGVVESMDKDSKLFGVSRLQELLKNQTSKVSSKDFVRDLLDRVIAYRDPSKILDDVTIVCLQRQ